MHLLRWNNISTQVRGAQHQTRVFYGEGGWKPRKCFPAPVEGGIFCLTFPFIEQAFALKTPLDGSVSAIDFSTIVFQSHPDEVHSLVQSHRSHHSFIPNVT